MTLPSINRLATVGLCITFLACVFVYTPLRHVPPLSRSPWIPFALIPVGIVLTLVGSLLRPRRPGSRVSRFLAPLALLVAVIAMPLLSGWPGPPRHQIEVAGLRRGYRVYVPRDYDGLRARPVVLVFHGFLQSWRSMRDLTAFHRRADEAGFLVVFPEGYRRSWNDGDDMKPAARKDIDDAAFVRALIERVVRDYAVDESRVYAVGFSNGGFLIVRHACRLADRIAAIGIVGAGVYPVWDGSCRPSRPVPAMFIVGTDDPALARLNERFAIVPARSGLAWAEFSDCAPVPDSAVIDSVGDGMRTVAVTYSDCPRGGEVEYLSVEGGGHTWPGGPQYLPSPLVGPTTRDFDATSTLWDFLQRHETALPTGRTTEKVLDAG